jgi:hypothetical protein
MREKVDYFTKERSDGSSLTDKEREAKKKRTEAARHQSCKDLTKLYVFAEYYICPRLKDAAMDAYRKCCVELWVVPGSEIEIVCGGTPKGSSMRKFIVAFFTKTCGTKKDFWAGCVATEGCSHPEFTKELAMQLFRTRDDEPIRRDQLKWKKVDACLYHDHVDVFDNKATEGLKS